MAAATAATDGARRGRAIAVLGSASDVGKSVIAAGLCRLLANEGVDVAPFKAQNMANQAGVTPDGLEMPRAQILQAIACRKVPHVDMGPVLMKPVSAAAAELVVLGRAVGMVEARAYFRDTRLLAGVAFEALSRLAARHEVIVLEGAGSPVELNLMERDFVNLRAARQVGAGLVLVVDIDRGGVFAQAKGTLDLLPAEDRARVVGIFVNRFRGDLTLFEDGVTILEELCGVPVLAVVPAVRHGLDEEDRPIEIPMNQIGPAERVRIGAILTPHVSNTEDLAPLFAEPDVHLSWVTDPALVREYDVVVLPGTKATVADLAQLAATGMAAAIEDAAARGAWIVGLCGGYQMLGGELADPLGTEGGARRWLGLGLLPIKTEFLREKSTREASVVSAWPQPGHRLFGYEIHHGSTTAEGELEPLFDGVGAEVGGRRDRVLGSYVHGMFASDSWRAALLNEVRAAKGMATQPVRAADGIDLKLDRWADHLRRALRPSAWSRLLRAIG
jgi:adenosylcobyric acid synthase